jgi:hypothetical protein
MSNVQHFGATGDGQNDDTEAIQHAVRNGDGLVEFPRGIYRLTRTVEVDLSTVNRTSLSGLGGTAKIRMTGPGPAFHFKGSHAKTADPGGFRPEEWLRERMPMIQNLEIEGAHPQADGVLVEGVMQATLTGVLIREMRHAIRLTDRARNLLISHCHLYHNTGVGVFLDQVNLHQTIITGSHISYCRLGGIRIENSEIRNLQITGNDIEYNNQRSHSSLSDEPAADIFIDVGKSGTVREGTIVGNTIQATYSPKGSNIRMMGGDADNNHRAGMWTIADNLIGSQNTNIHLTCVRGVTINGNYIYSGHHRNILVERSRNIVIGPNCLGHNPDYQKNELATGIRLEKSTNCNITGLLIEDAEAGKHTLPGVAPISRQGLLEIVGCHRVNLSGVQVLDPISHGLYLEDCTETLVTGCTILDDRDPRKMGYAILWKGDSPTGNMIAQCRLGRGHAGDLKVPGSVRLQGNLQDE